MHEEDSALNNLQCLICHKTQPNQTLHILYIYIYIYDVALNNLKSLVYYKTQPNQILYI